MAFKPNHVRLPHTGQAIFSEIVGRVECSGVPVTRRENGKFYWAGCPYAASDSCSYADTCNRSDAGNGGRVTVPWTQGGEPANPVTEFTYAKARGDKVAASAALETIQAEVGRRMQAR